jgi:hypothetical protein
VHWTGFETLSVLFLVTGVVFFQVYAKKQKKALATNMLFGGTALFIFSFLILNIKKIEGYTQRTPIEFYKSLKGKNVYLKTIRYKSYAPYFYREEEKPESAKYYDQQWMLKGDIDKPVYFVTRVMHRGHMEKISAKDLIFIKEKNGFLFHKRLPKEMCSNQAH